MTQRPLPDEKARVAADAETGAWWPEASRCASPNRDQRPVGLQPELIVIHAISLPPGQYGGPFIGQLFTNRLDPEAHPSFAPLAGLRVSAHAVITRDGRCTQFVPFTERAWHAGVSCWRGRERCNDFSIGIELEGSDAHPFTDPQYATLDRLIRWLCGIFVGLTPDALAGHSEIAPGRKTDPGPGFDWAGLAIRLQQETPT